MSTNVILASGSSIRADLLRNAGVEFSVQIPRIDESSIMASMIAASSKPHDIADTLAEYKARRIADKNPDSIIIAADQVLSCNGKLYSKATDMDQARLQINELKGQGHQLLSAVVIYENTKPVWRHIGRAQLAMRDFSDEFLEQYLLTHGDSLLTSVGCYKLETAGVQLFSNIQGDYFTILGLPLIQVLGFLRTRGIIPQ